MKKETPSYRHKFPAFDFVADPEIDDAIVRGVCTVKDRIREFIHRRRLQMIIHSVIYYRLDENLISDHTWQLWANQLAEVQRQYKTLTCIAFHDELFEDWDGSTGNHLCLSEYYSQAEKLIAISKRHQSLV